MKNLMRKEIKLSASLISFLFILFSMMTMVPGYPILVGAFFVCFGVFQSFQNACANNDILYTVLLPVKKTDAVPYTNNAMMNANQFFLGGNLLVFALFNWLFVGGFFKTAYKYGKPFLFFSIALFVLIVIAETLHHIPGLAFLNKTDAMGDVGMWLFFVVTLLVYIFVTAMSCKTSMKRFEAVDM